MKIDKFFFIAVLLILAASLVNAQSPTFAQRFNSGVTLYNTGRFLEAAGEFRRAQESASYENDWAKAIYWVILSELAASDYGSALLDMAELERKAPSSVYNRDMTYHRARIYYNQGYFENALHLFRRYIDSVTETGPEAEDRKAAAFYWMGECLYIMGQFDDAERFYSFVVGSFPESPKRDISTYRIDLIRQKKIENELLALLQWSHEEALRTGEEYQRRLRTYEYTLNNYQRRIAEIIQTERTRSISPQEQSNNYMEIPLDEFIENINIDYHEDLIEKARQLNFELEQLIRNLEMEAW